MNYQNSLIRFDILIFWRLCPPPNRDERFHHYISLYGKTSMQVVYWKYYSFPAEKLKNSGLPIFFGEIYGNI